MPTRPAPIGGLMSMAWLDGAPRRLPAELDANRYLKSRLEWIESLGYPGVLLWGGTSTDRMSQWTRHQWRQVSDFTRGS